MEGPGKGDVKEFGFSSIVVQQQVTRKRYRSHANPPEVPEDRRCHCVASSEGPPGLGSGWKRCTHTRWQPWSLQRRRAHRPARRPACSATVRWRTTSESPESRAHRAKRKVVPALADKKGPGVRHGACAGACVARGVVGWRSLVRCSRVVGCAARRGRGAVEGSRRKRIGSERGGVRWTSMVYIGVDVVGAVSRCLRRVSWAFD